MKTQKITLYALFIALTCAGTMVIRIPFPLTQGYLNLGDTILLAAAIVLGRHGGFLAGGFGSFLADVLTAYPYAPATLVIKGLEGYICGYIFEKQNSKLGRMLAVIIGGLVMVLGYFIFECFIVGVHVSALSALANLGQAMAGASLGYILSIALEKAMRVRARV